MLVIAKDIYRKVLSFTLEMQSDLEELQTQVQTQSSLSELADLDLVISEIQKLLDGLRKKANKTLDISAKYLTLKHILTNNQLGYIETSVKTDYVTATPRCRKIPKMPSATNKEARQEYALLCEDLGIPDEVLENDAFRPHYPGMVELIANREEEGREPPKGLSINVLYDDYKITRRKRKEILEEVETEENNPF